MLDAEMSYVLSEMFEADPDLARNYMNDAQVAMAVQKLVNFTLRKSHEYRKAMYERLKDADGNNGPTGQNNVRGVASGSEQVRPGEDVPE